MTTKIPVRKGLELVLPINLMLLYFFYKGFLENNAEAIITCLAVILFANYLFFSVTYKIKDNTLLIWNGLTPAHKIPISEITKIEKTWNPISSPAPGIFGRVQIYYPMYNSIVISPKNYQEFKRILLDINPNIEIN